MKPPPFHYYDPNTVKEAIALLSSLDNAKLLAGGQSLMPMLNMRYVLPDHVIDLNRITELSHIQKSGERIVIGSMTRQREIERSEFLTQYCPIFRGALIQVGHRQTRNRGTIGGSLCHLDPAAELPAVLSVLDATIHITGPKGERNLPIAEFPAFYMTPAIELDELMTGVSFEPWPEGHKSAFVEFARRPGDFAIVGVAAMLVVDNDRVVQRAAIALAGIAAGPIRCVDAEEILKNSNLSEETIDAAAKTCREIDAMEDIHAPSSYRQHLATELVKRAVRTALDKPGAGSS